VQRRRGGTAWAQAKVDLGKREFKANCVACHGVSGKGNGPLNELLKRGASGLTKLQQRNGGVFLVERTYRIIEGGGEPEHGPSDMPVWGRQYSVKKAAVYYMDVPYNQEVYVRMRILSLLKYLSRLQTK
jgi:mono/diheme cytochrome c family protein